MSVKRTVKSRAQWRVKNEHTSINSSDYKINNIENYEKRVFSSKPNWKVLKQRKKKIRQSDNKNQFLFVDLSPKKVRNEPSIGISLESQLRQQHNDQQPQLSFYDFESNKENLQTPVKVIKDYGGQFSLTTPPNSSDSKFNEEVQFDDAKDAFKNMLSKSKNFNKFVTPLKESTRNIDNATSGAVGCNNSEISNVSNNVIGSPIQFSYNLLDSPKLDFSESLEFSTCFTELDRFELLDFSDEFYQANQNLLG